LVDELDDAVAVLRHLGPQILRLTAASALFAAAGTALVFAPRMTLTLITLVASGVCA
jgi:hypothetical protein